MSMIMTSICVVLMAMTLCCVVLLRLMITSCRTVDDSVLGGVVDSDDVMLCSTVVFDDVVSYC